MKHLLNQLILPSILAFSTSCSYETLEPTASMESTIAESASVVWYNAENLFDIIDDTTSSWDNEFLPNGDKAYTAERYEKKLADVAKVILSEPNTVVIGLCELENRRVIDELLEQEEFQSKNWKVIHREGKDTRGIDVAILYVEEAFVPTHNIWKTPNVALENGFQTREFLISEGLLYGEPTAISVNHWPSRRGGQEGSDYKRFGVAQEVKATLDSILSERAETHLIVMGDMNDYEENNSIQEFIQDNAVYTHLEDSLNAMGLGIDMNGTYKYSKAWNSLDHMIVSNSLLDASGLRVDVTSFNTITQVEGLEILMQDNHPRYGDNRLTVNRMYFGDSYNGGISDHLALRVNILLP